MKPFLSGRVSTDALGGAAPNGRIMAGDERAVQPERVKAFNQSHWLVSTPRLLGLLPGDGCGKPKPVSDTHE
jgi:hypothetical protein